MIGPIEIRYFININMQSVVNAGYFYAHEVKDEYHIYFTTMKEDEALLVPIDGLKAVCYESGVYLDRSD
jgi:hypothetical protein